MSTLYFVTARSGFQTVFGGHWLAESPKAAIDLAKADASSNPHGALPVDELEWKARRSNADPAANACNIVWKGIAQ